MIDYDKLRLANDMLRGTIYGMEVHLNGEDEFPVVVRKFDKNGDSVYLFTEHNLDLLIEKLQEITKAEPKYKVGDSIFLLMGSSIMRGDILDVPNNFFYDYGVYVWQDGNAYGGYETRVEEQYLYPSRQSLIESQIDHWARLLNKETSTHSEDMSMKPPFEGEIKGFNSATDNLQKVECEHESDGCRYAAPWRRADEESFIEFLCTKCGEFYR